MGVKNAPLWSVPLCLLPIKSAFTPLSAPRCTTRAGCLPEWWSAYCNVYNSGRVKRLRERISWRSDIQTEGRRYFLNLFSELVDVFTCGDVTQIFTGPISHLSTCRQELRGTLGGNDQKGSGVSKGWRVLFWYYATYPGLEDDSMSEKCVCFKCLLEICFVK